MKYGHGDDLYKYEGKIKHNFSSNIWSHADLSGLFRHLSEHVASVASYPTPDAHELAGMIERKIFGSKNLEKGSVLVNNGTTGGIYLLAQLFSGAESLIFNPTFSEYESACSIFGHKIINEGHDDWIQHIENFSAAETEKRESECKESENKESEGEESERKTKSKLCWICNPNNPDGFAYDKAQLLEAIERHKDIIFILDMAYEDYTCAALPSAEELCGFGNAIALYSMTKQYCVPGIRLGYTAANSDIIKRLERIQQPWNVGQLAIEAGKYLIDNGIGNMPDKRDYTKRAEIFRRKLDEEEGFNAYPSATNFFLAKTDFATADELKAFLAERHGILIRDASNFHSLTPQHFRIAVQSDEENELLMKALKEFRDEREKNMR